VPAALIWEWYKCIWSVYRYFDQRLFFQRHIDKGQDLVEAVAAKPDKDGTSALRDLAKTVKTRVSAFSERLESTRERLEDTARAFCLVDKAYDWSLETGKFINRVKEEGNSDTVSGRIQSRVSSHPPLSESHFTEVLALARKLDNDKLVDQVRAAQERHREVVDAVQNAVGGMPVASRRRSLPTLPSQQECSCTCPRLTEIREHAEDSDEEWAGKRGLRRTSTWQYPAENFEEVEPHSGDSDQHSKSSGEECDLPPVPSFNSHLYCTDRGSNFSLDLTGGESILDPKAHKYVFTFL